MTYSAEPQDVQAAFASVVVDEWVRAGVSDVVVSPGSRSTPVLVALAEAAEQGRLSLHVVLDERSAGFFALGLALATGRPAPVVTTSGTAAVELHPAVVEAHHAGVPFIAVSADRPEELQGCGAAQTVDQEGLYGPAVRWSASPGVPELAAARSWRSLASRAVAEALGGARPPGPVHLNLAFREPLVGSAQALPGDVAAGRPRGLPWHTVQPPEEMAPREELLRALQSAGERGLVVAGRGTADSPGAAEALRELSRTTCWPVLADPLSGCRQPGTIAAADTLLRTDTVRHWEPDVVVRMGAPWASRVVNEWLAGLDCLQVLVDPGSVWAAPDRQPAEVVRATPLAFCRAVSTAASRALSDGAAFGPRGDWHRRWSVAEKMAQSAVDAALAGEQALSEPAIARTVVASLRPGSALMVSSSMPVRDVEWWSKPRDGARFLSNRGASGIDGVLSTALGVAAARKGAPVTCALLGDLAFLHDAGALLKAAERGLDLDVVVVDNDGGGIFNFLPQAAKQPPERFERLWGTPQGADLAAIARAYGASTEEVPDVHHLGSALAGSKPGLGLRVFLARTDRAANVTVHNRLHSAVAAAVRGLA